MITLKSSGGEIDNALFLGEQIEKKVASKFKEKRIERKKNLVFLIIAYDWKRTTSIYNNKKKQTNKHTWLLN